MGRAPCCDKAKVKKGPWSAEEDAKLKDYIHNNGTGGNWIALPQKVGLNRCGKSCRLRWLNYLRPNIKHGEFSDEEDGIICSLYATIGSRWSIIAAQLPGRTDNDIKNYWNTKLKKKFFMGFSSQSQERSSYQSNMITNHHLPSLNTTNLITPSPYLPQTPSFYDDSISNPKPFSILYKDPTTFTDGFFDPFHGNFEDVKSNSIIFGGEGGVTNSPDGSCITNPMNNHDNQGFLISDNEYGFSSANACFRQNNPLAYDGIQEITELISSSPICSDKLGFFVDYPPENVRF